MTYSAKILRALIYAPENKLTTLELLKQTEIEVAAFNSAIKTLQYAGLVSSFVLEDEFELTELAKKTYDYILG